MSKSKERLAPINLDPEQYVFEYFRDEKYDHLADAHLGQRSKALTCPYLEDDKNGNVVVYYPSLQETGIQTWKDTEGKKHYFTRKRFTHPAAEERKYFQEGGTGIRIFFPKNTLAKIRAGEEIPILYMTEGEIKSIYADHYGLDVIGLGGIQNFIASKGSKSFHPDITYIINHCKVKKIVLIGDSDSRSIIFDKNKPEKDYRARLYSFYIAVLNLKECLKDIEAEGYFCNINSKYKEFAKGIDDLFVYLTPEAAPDVVSEIKKMKTGNTFEFKYSDTRPGEIYEWFYLDTEKGRPASFYRRFDKDIDTNEFKFHGSIWKFNSEDGQLTMIRHADSSLFIRVGCKYIKNIYFVNSQKRIERRMVPWEKSEIAQDYIIHGGIRDFLFQIPKYDTFVNIPENDPEKYNQTPNGCYNLYYKLDHELRKGEWPYIENYLKHLFQNQYQDKYLLILDYFTILYRYPTNPLPIIALVSRERETGKSNLLWLMIDMFGENATVLGSTDFKDSFNADYAGKLVIGINEAYLRDKVIQDKIKTWSTDPYVSMRALFANRQRIDNYAKIIITSNDENNFVKIDEEEIRYLVCRVPQIAKGQMDPSYRGKMQAEIPAFLDFLKHREIHYPNTNRAWFANDLLQTDSLQRLKSSSKIGIEKELDILMQQKFMWSGHGKLDMSLMDLHKEINPAKGTEIFKKWYVKETLEKKKIKKTDKGRYDLFVLRSAVNDEGTMELTPDWEKNKQNSFYTFFAEDFCTRQEMMDWSIPLPNEKMFTTEEVVAAMKPDTKGKDLFIFALFEEFWQIYDKNIDKEKCQAAFEKLELQDIEEILKVLPEYIQSTPDKMYRLNPLKYLETKAWLNEIIVPAEKKPASNAVDTENIDEPYVGGFE